MKKTKFLLMALTAMAITGLNACSSDDYTGISTNSPEQPLAEDYLTISYDGHKYENIPVAYDTAGNYMFLDQEFSPIYRYLSVTKPQLAMYMVSEKEIIIYDDVNMFLKDKNLSKIPKSKVTRTDPNAAAELTIWDDKKFKDRSFSYSLGLSDTYTYILDLGDKSHKFNDKCSSLKIVNSLPNVSTSNLYLKGSHIPYNQIAAVFIGYEDHSFGGRSIITKAEPGETRAHSNVGNFNDKLSSFEFFFALSTNVTINI